MTMKTGGRFGGRRRQHHVHDDEATLHDRRDRLTEASRVG